MQNEAIEKELKAQEDFVFIWKAGIFAAFLFLVLIGANGHGNIFMFGCFCLLAFYLVKWPPIREELERRRKVVAFKTQVQNLYVFSNYPSEYGTGDKTVTDAWKRAQENLKAAGNTHEVRVHLAIFRDVMVYHTYTDKNGREHSFSDWREVGSASQSWEEYLAFCDRYRADQDEKRLRELRKDGKGFEWVNQNIFGQHATEN